ncbi:MAG: hypothetical protein RL701_2878 [Pseudomonadota bacterium]
MKTSVIALLLLIPLSSGCATATGCGAGAAAGLVTGAVRLVDSDGRVAAFEGYLLPTAAFGAVVGCVAGLFAGMKATAIERARSANAQPQQVLAPPSAQLPRRNEDELR